MEDKLFVYGTLMGNFDSKIATLLKKNSRFLGEGQVNGKLFDLGSYPGLMYDENSAFSVQGHLFQVLDATYLFPVLDEYEGIGPHFPKPNAYERILVPVRHQGQIVSCYCYVYVLPIEKLTWITSGNYLQYLADGNTSHWHFIQNT